MRPLTLHAEGFGVFRDAIDIDFDGVDYFALVGPTGAGKSTVIDALCFALYGSVPRYGDERQVARVVSIGKQEAKVSLAFTVGEQPYRATRVVRIRGGKASTPEALLERIEPDGPPTLLAGSARELKPAVERLLGLPFAHFTKCVVLPQGEFARFLHDEPAKRRDLLTKLLDFEVYDRIGALARQRAAAARSAVEIHERQLATFAGATEDARAAAEVRRAELLELHHALDTARPEDQRLVAAIAEADAQARAASTLAAELDQIRVPRAVTQLTEKLDGALVAARAATEAVATAQRALAALDAEVESLPDRAELAHAHDAHDAVAALGPALDDARVAEAAAATDAARVAERATRAEAHLADLQERLGEVRDAHAAHALAGHLVAGEPCPVCRQTVTAVPKRKRPAALTKVEGEVKEARRIGAAAREAVEQATRVHADATAARKQLEEQLATQRALTEAFPDAGTITGALERIDATLAAHQDARIREREARAVEATAATRRAEADAQLDSLRSELQQQRDRFVRAGLEPPTAGDDLAAAWTALAEWSATAQTEQRSIAGTASKSLEQARTERATTFGALLERARALHVETRAKDLAGLRDDVLEHGRDARNELQRIDDVLEQSRKVAEERRAAREEHEVADLLGSRLRSDRFEKWLLVEALDVLVEAASANLEALSSGQYSLRSSGDDEFVVVDHRNADETRSVRTLSGGETFQASLALALALSDQLAELSAAGGIKLDAIFLDEGFGSLDVETLETVAGTIESLSTSGRMVGIVTHVPALAERVPVRYRVTRTDRSAHVEREDG
jgi:exonuclease SbcC